MIQMIDVAVNISHCLLVYIFAHKFPKVSICDIQSLTQFYHLPLMVHVALILLLTRTPFMGFDFLNVCVLIFYS